MWINIKELLNEDKKFPTVEIINHLDEENIKLKISSNAHHDILKIEK